MSDATPTPTVPSPANRPPHYEMDDGYAGGKRLCACVRGENHSKALTNVPITADSPALLTSTENGGTAAVASEPQTAAPESTTQENGQRQDAAPAPAPQPNGNVATNYNKINDAVKADMNAIKPEPELAPADSSNEDVFSDLGTDPELWSLAFNEASQKFSNQDEAIEWFAKALDAGKSEGYSLGFSKAKAQYKQS